MRYGRSRLPEIILVTVFGVGGGFYAFQPALKQYQIEQTTTTAAAKVEGDKSAAPQAK